MGLDAQETKKKKFWRVVVAEEAVGVGQEFTFRDSESHSAVESSHAFKPILPSLLGKYALFYKHSTTLYSRASFSASAWHPYKGLSE